ncbi:PREDICTED: cytosolic Fe-S cluster assembly factor NUBP2 homolog [Priapulus caudatus]|uniref:Cytosolic Fe-S cluster assembly factor NUBP2 homolog n=1 Tax=Priapulus caudatus TaxID=37621 RepID=A0ABM1EEN7_PRICU|nr:PREDICTED: cytosolic Fe-S cluster assembly factor NUBP2 homolog [Priapulus caudatus]XP_014670659.1 PREDICTED: cytosolic Fe-S cluster assembly factor NUBP2 homolog [Priapulus caudatus]XP_014670660.1 PREDICTED: cytosolic Fe-S cluster assembly factor NUBP2 homolog [Priapulus caudatus]
MEAAEQNKKHFSSVKNVILVLSGKGGVGKSTVAIQLALGLKHAGKRVGLLDVDLCGPSIPRMLNLENQDVHQCPEGWVPVFADTEQRLAVMSIGFLLQNRDEAVVWRGPKKNAMIKQFLEDVMWTERDFLVIDTPPGTSDEHITVVENLRRCDNLRGAILVTTPQAVSVGDVRREITFCKKTGIPVLGLVENMSGFVCPHCSECTNVFSKGGGEGLAEEAKVPFLGCIPLDPNLTQSLEDGQNFSQLFSQSPTATAISSIVQKILSAVEGS